MKTLELFCGHKSFTKFILKHYPDATTITLDNEQSLCPTICCDILEWDYQSLDYIPDILWVSPDCRSFSNQAYGGYNPSRRHVDMMPLNETGVLGDKLLNKSIEIINYYLKINIDLIWFMENPRGTMFRSPLMKKLKHFQNRCRYCDYDDPRTKRTIKYNWEVRH